MTPCRSARSPSSRSPSRPAATPKADVDRIVRALGLRIARGSGGICAVATLRRVYARGGPAVLSRALRIIRDAYGEAGLDGPVIDGIGLVCQRYDGELSEQRAVERLSVGARRGVRADQPGRAAAPVHRQRHRPVRGRRRGRGHQPRLGRQQAAVVVESPAMTARVPLCLPASRSRHVPARQREPLPAGRPGSQKEESPWAIGR